MSEQKMREALEGLVKMHRQHYGLDGAWDAAMVAAEHALATHAGEQLGLTDDEIATAMGFESAEDFEDHDYCAIISDIRAVIAAHEAKKGGAA